VGNHKDATMGVTKMKSGPTGASVPSTIQRGSHH
jgi:hypothetical protein